MKCDVAILPRIHIEIFHKTFHVSTTSRFSRATLLIAYWNVRSEERSSERSPDI